MNGSPVGSPDPSGKDEEVVLRLGDVLRLIPAELLKPGSHDRMRPLRLSVDELAKQIAQGRVSVPLARLASACPDIFMAPDKIPPQEEIALPLQRLLDQLGLVANRSPVQSNIPKEQVVQAREEAGRILNTAAGDPAQQPGRAELPQPFAVAKAISAAKQFLGFFGRPAENSTPPPAVVPPAPDKPESAPSVAPIRKPEPPPPPPDGFISLALKPILFLLPPEALEPNFAPPADARVLFPLSLIDPQLAAGHVEVPVEELIKGLPENLQNGIRPVPDLQAWLPLDEIFQSLPHAHLYYMPPLELGAEKRAEAETKESPAEMEANLQPVPAGEQPASEQFPATPVATEIAAETPKEEPPLGSGDSNSEEAASDNAAPETPVAAAEKNSVISEPKNEETPALPPLEVVVAPEPPPISAEPSPEPAEPAPAEPAPSARAPWMRGFQVPPPRLFSGSTPAPEQAAEPPQEIPAAKTPEAKQTADFLASQPGIFAAAAFVEGAIFASADFPASRTWRHCATSSARSWRKARRARAGSAGTAYSCWVANSFS